MDSVDPHAPIAVFDSGLGGLTVARALHRRLPAETLVYFGDAARVPYGAKSAQTVHRFTRECLRFCLQVRPKMMVLACNTASALALDALIHEFDVPVIGVLEPGATAATQAARAKHPHGTSRIGLIATEATIASNAYPLAVRRLDPELHVIGRACPLLVPMIEEGRGPDDPIVQAVLNEYLAPLKDLHLSSVILGCTHYPVLAPAIQAILGPETPLIDSAEQTALVVAKKLTTMGGCHPGTAGRSMTCYVTDQGQRFERLAALFFGQPVGQPVWVTPEMLEATAAESVP